MITIKTKINLYKYNELSEKARLKAFDEHEEFLRLNPAEYETEDEKGVIIKYDNLDEWTEEEIKEYVEESIGANEYLFFESGEQAHITHFTGKHEKSGTTEFYFMGETYKI